MTMAAISVVLLASVLLPLNMVSQVRAGSTLARIRAAKSLSCGIVTEEPEYSMADAHGNRSAFDIDLCKAVAVAVLGPNARFTVKPFRDEASSLLALKTGQIDLLATGSPYIRNNNGSFGFGRPIFYDYQGFLVNKTMGINSPRDLAGKKVCFLIGTEIENQVSAYMRRQKISYIPGPFSEEGEMEAAFLTGNCTAITADVSQLAFERIAFGERSKHLEILPDVIAKDPLAPAYRLDDPQWAAIVDWLMQALIQAEESGVTRANLPEMKKSDDLAVRRLLGNQRGYGQFLALDDDWASWTIEAIGNFGEIYERDLGSGSAMKLDRGLNNLWTHGGLMYANPLR